MRLLLNQTNRNVTGASTQIAGPNAKRKGVIISCPAVAAIWISFQGEASVGKGIRLAPNGTPFMVVDEWAAHAMTEEIFAISTGVAENIGVLDIFG